jgi:hypothetical protein
MEPELPAGMQTFEELRTRKTIYVDKTEYFPLLPKGRKVVFCARPQRFGKSLTVTALDAFYSGLRELFQGLAAEKYMNSPEFSPKPVIRLDMSRFRDCDSKEILEKKIIAHLKDIAEEFKVTLSEIDSADAFSRLLASVGKATSKKNRPAD